MRLLRFRAQLSPPAGKPGQIPEGSVIEARKRVRRLQSRRYFRIASE
jgi:hypothetical protein